MTDYVPPLKDMLFNLKYLSEVDRVLQLQRFGDFDVDVLSQVVEEAGKFASDILAPINTAGDQKAASVENRHAVTAPEFAEAHARFVENGWQSLEVSPEFDGMGMPGVVAAAAGEAWQSACISFTLCPMLTSGAIVAIEAHGSESLKNTFLPKMASGAWTGTMNLTEPQAGSDLAAVTTRAVPEGDHYRISGSKIFITWGDQEFSENIIHLVLARLPDAPEGVRGISLFLVPKFLVDENGAPGDRNDVFVTSVEHKLGIHASPTCVMSFGEGDGAIGYLVGEENKGLACMFTMMNHARVGVGIQGLGISERAYQLAKSFALDRRQGKAPGVKGTATIIHHPDVRRMLLVMKTQVEAMRSLAYYTAGIQDLAHHSDVDAERDDAAQRVALLTPVVKAWMTEVAQEITSLGVQVHGGMGFVEETGAAQHMRDARILPIYEGTTGIQALDFVGRKIMADEGRAIGSLIREMQALDQDLAGDERLAGIRAALSSGVTQLQHAVAWLLDEGPLDPNAAGSASVNLLMAAGVIAGGWQMARAGLAVTRSTMDDKAFAEAKLMSIRFYAEHIMPRARAYADAATAGANAVMEYPESAF